MLVLCKHCLKSCKKFGRVDCEDYFKPTIEDAEKELRKLQDGSDPERKKELEKRINHFNWGMK